jgi:hypothetical protein
MGLIPPAAAHLEIIPMNFETYLIVAFLGFLGGMLSGFFGSGGAFVMTPGMMSLGIPGINAVSGNIAHKFGKAVMGSKRHAEMGHVDAKLGIVMIIFLLTGLEIAVNVQAYIYEIMGKAASNLYISIIFIIVLTAVASFMYRDIKKSMRKEKVETDGGTVTKFSRKIQSINIPPMVEFKTAKIRVSLWFPAGIALGTGFLAGTIGVGGFIGVPGMIYLLGIPATVAAGTELFLAVFDGAVGAYLYTIAGFLDIRIPILLYLGSMIGIQTGAIATKYVREVMIKVVLVIVMVSSTISRAMSVPKYLNTMGVIHMNTNIARIIDIVGGWVLYIGAAVGVLVIIISMRKGMKKLAVEKAPIGTPSEGR